MHIKLKDTLKSLIIGDLHFDDNYTGQHKDYYANCKHIMEEITQKIKEEGIGVVILLGDLIGINTKNLKSREALLYFIKKLQEWSSLTCHPVYSLVGNHDEAGKLTDFGMLEAMGLLVKPYDIVVGGVKYHFLHYGEEGRQINLDTSKYNIALVHNNIQVPGLTTWFHGGNDGIGLSTMYNLKGIDFMVAGHIHNPSPHVVKGNIAETDVSLIYLGSPTRPQKDPNIWDKVHLLSVFTDENSDVHMDLKPWELVPAEDIFNLTYDDMEDDLVAKAPVIDLEDLTKILSELELYNINSATDYASQLKRFAGLDEEAASLALQYVEAEQAKFK